jgi:hypothetical protein
MKGWLGSNKPDRKHIGKENLNSNQTCKIFTTVIYRCGCKARAFVIDTLFLTFVFFVLHETQHNDTEQNDTEHNDAASHNDIQQNDTQQNNT